MISSARTLITRLVCLVQTPVFPRHRSRTAGNPPAAKVGLAIVAGVLLCHQTAEAQTKPLKVFVLAGQSNMQGHAHIRTFDHIGMDPKTAPLLREMRNADNTPRVCRDVWISSIGSADQEQYGQLTAGFGAKAGGPKIGPEFTFGIFMHKQLHEPILIIKTAWGGKSLHTDFRPRAPALTNSIRHSWKHSASRART